MNPFKVGNDNGDGDDDGDNSRNAYGDSNGAGDEGDNGSGHANHGNEKGNCTEYLRRFPHNIRAIMAKIKLPKNPLSMVIFWIKVRRSY